MFIDKNGCEITQENYKKYLINSSDYETGLNKDERILINKMNHDRLFNENNGKKE